MRVAVAILNWNTRAFLEQFLPDVIAHSPDYAEVVVIDNASSDDSVAVLRQKFPSVKIIINEKNFGFAQGYNEGLRKIEADYFVLLNSDVQVTANWMEPIIALMEADPQIAVCQPKLLSYHRREEFEYAGAAGGFIDKYGYPFCRGRIFESLEKDHGQYDDTREVFWATGACLFVRSRTFFEAGELDGDFFAHMEEIDLCWRLKNLGHKIFYCGDSVVYHVGGGTLSKVSPQKTFLNFRNNLVLLTKNHAPKYFRRKILLRQILDGVAALKFLAGGQIPHGFAVLRAHLNFYGSMRRTIQKRRAMQRKISHYTTSEVYRNSIVRDYFLKGKTRFSDLDETLFGS